MRIEEINLQAFGPFTDRSLSFSENDGVVVLYGPNEAGKSSMLRALKAWLYGIPAQSTDNFIHDHQKMRIAGRLRRSDSRELTFVRRKGNKKTILDPSDNSLDDGILDQFLSQVGEDTFTKMFGIDNDSLVRGGKELLEDRGGVGNALFAAGMSGLQLRRILQTIEKQASELFQSRGSKQEISEAIRNLTEARKKIREDSVSGKDMNDLEEELRKSQDSVKHLDVSLVEERTSLSRLERLNEALPKLAKRTGLLARLKTMEDVPILSEDFSERRREAVQNGKQAAKDKAKYEPELMRLKEKLEDIAGVGGFVPYADKVNSLQISLGAHLKAKSDLVGLNIQHETYAKETRRLLTEIRPDMNLEDLRSLHVTEARKKRIKELALGRETTLSAENKSNELLSQTTDKLEEARKKLDGMPSGRDTSELEDTLSTLQMHGDLAKVLRTAQQEQQTLSDQAENMLARLGLWSGSLEAIERLPVPTNETIGRFHTNFEELLATRAAVEKRMRERNGECTDIEDEIDGMRRKGVFLTEDELAGTRDRRDKTWGLIRGAWLQAEELERPASDVAQEYEQEVKTADDHADMLRKNAEQVATLTERLRQKERLQKKNQEDSAELERIMKGQEQVAAEWAATWLGSGIDPLPPKEMQAWLQRHAQLLELCRQIRVTRAREQEADMEIKAGVESLNLSLKALDESPCAPDETYGKLIERCKALVFRLSKMNSDLEARAKSIDDLEQDRQLLERELGKAQSAWTRWQQDWAECMQWLGLPPKTSIDEADSYIEKVDTLLGCSKETTDLTERITGIKKDAESLESEVRTLVVAIAPDLTNRSISEAIEELQRRFLKDKESVTQQREYLNKQAETQIQLDDACATLIEADRELAQLCQEAGCDTPDQLEQIEQKSMERRELMRGVEQVEESLQTIAKGIPLEKLEDEASSMDADSLFALIPSAKEKIRSLGNEKDQENMNIGQITEKIAALKGRSGAAHAAEMAQQHLALIEEKSRQYIKLKLASIVLRGEIKKYQTINQGPLLARAGDLFARLTLNSFTKLSVDYNEKDDPFLLGFRPTGETVPVEGMSDGTRDQLYLSLRLATLEKFLETSEPMPFIVDDILIRFDDERAKATLDVLAELATKTQVLFFTHHARLFEFSRSPEMTGKVRALNLQK